jgi:hypothetical protein
MTMDIVVVACFAASTASVPQGKNDIYVEANVLALDIPKIVESRSKRVDRRPRLDRQDTDRDYFPSRLLRTSGERPSGRTADQSDELAALHSITCSATASSILGITRPRALRLITSSNLVGACTGRSAASVPRRMRLTRIDWTSSGSSMGPNSGNSFALWPPLFRVNSKTRGVKQVKPRHRAGDRRSEGSVYQARSRCCLASTNGTKLRLLRCCKPVPHPLQRMPQKHLARQGIFGFLCGLETVLGVVLAQLDL